MNSRNEEARPAVAARRRGRATLRAATVSVGAAGLVTAGVVAFTLPGATATSSAAAAKASTPITSKATSKAASGSSKATASPTASSSSLEPSSAPSSSSGSAQTTSGAS
jgi:hypothetical protein